MRRPASGKWIVKPEQDLSLRAASLRRATGRELPRTLTPYEWQQWYDEHGVPSEHTAASQTRGPIWSRLLNSLKRNT